MRCVSNATHTYIHTLGRYLPGGRDRATPLSGLSHPSLDGLCVWTIEVGTYLTNLPTELTKLD